MEDVFVPVFLFAAIAAVFITLIVSRAQTRRLMIERGVFGEDYAAVLGAENQMRMLSALKWGLVLGGIGLALVLLTLFGLDDMDEASAAAFGIVTLGAAVGFLGYYLLTRKESYGPVVPSPARRSYHPAEAAPAHTHEQTPAGD